MGMFSRMSTIVKSKMNRILDSAEDPRETLDYSYEKQLEMLQNVKRGVVEMVTAKRRIQQQADRVGENITRLDRQARQAVEAGRDDLARLALQRKQTALTELEGLDEQIAGMEREQEKLTQAEQRLQAKVNAFRNQKESSRPSIRRLRLRSASAPRWAAFPRKWATCRWRCSEPRTRRTRCGLRPAPSTNWWPPACWTTSPAPKTISSVNWRRCRLPATWRLNWPH